MVCSAEKQDKASEEALCDEGMWSDCVAWHSANRMQTNDKHGMIGEKSFDLFLTAYLFICRSAEDHLKNNTYVFL